MSRRFVPAVLQELFGGIGAMCFSCLLGDREGYREIITYVYFSLYGCRLAFGKPVPIFTPSSFILGIPTQEVWYRLVVG